MKTNYVILLLCLLSFWRSAGLAETTDASSFNPVPISVTSQGAIPVGTVIAWPSTSWPPNATRWLECNGQAVPSSSQYSILRSLVGANVPNYNDQFLRGTTTLSQVGSKVSDSIKSHSVYVPGQNAPVSGNLNSTGLSGSASPQSYTYQGNAGGETVLTWVDGLPNYGQTNVEHMTWLNGSTSGGSISGSLNSGALTGTAYVSSQTGTYSGASETAPVHTKVRYLIRAIP
ncbi:MAG: phage tail protein [Desulfovibrio sp.]